MISCNITMRSEWIDNWADYLNWPHLQKLQKLISMRKLRRSISNHWGFSNIRSSRSGNKRNHSTLGFTILPLLHNAHILHLVDVNGFIFQVVFPKHTITDYAFKFKSIFPWGCTNLFIVITFEFSLSTFAAQCPKIDQI